MKRRHIRISALIIFTSVLSFALGQNFNKSTNSVDQALNRIATAGALDKSALERAAIEGMLRATGDRWSTYYDSNETSEESQNLAGRYSGVGIWVRAGIGGGSEISSLKKDSVAKRSGLKVGDVIILVDEVDLSSASVNEVAAALRGNPGTVLKLSVLRKGVEKKFKLEREEFQSNDVASDQVKKNILYLRIDAFSEQVVKDIKAELGQGNYQKGLILDLRDNPGGILSVATDFAALFLSKGAIVSYDMANGDRKTIQVEAPASINVPVAILINQNTASSAEVVAGALQDRNRAVLVGANTFGKGSVQESLKLANGSSIEITVGRLRTPSGKFIEGVGIKPDLIASESQSLPKAIKLITALSDISKPADQKKFPNSNVQSRGHNG
jgi:carboxyl-terminal processing protease